MNYLVIVVLLVLQTVFGTPNLQRHILEKSNHLQQLTTDLPLKENHVNSNNFLEQEMLRASIQLYKHEASVCISFLEEGIVNNTRDNEKGKELQKYLETAVGYVPWLNNNLEENNPKLIENIKLAITNFQVFIPFSQKVLRVVQESSKDAVRSFNGVMGAIDNSLFVFVNLNEYIESRKLSNHELCVRIKKVLDDATQYLRQIPNGRGNVEELLGYSRDLKRYISHLSIRLANLRLPQKILTQLDIMTKEIDDVFRLSSNELFLLQNYYKNWMSELSRFGDILYTAKDKTYIRVALFDILGIVAYFKTLFEVLSM